MSKKLLPHLLPQIFLTNFHLQWVVSPVVAASIRSANRYRLIKLSASFRLRERYVPTPGMPMNEPATSTLKWPTSDHESCVCFVCDDRGVLVTGFGSGADRGYQTSSLASRFEARATSSHADAYLDAGHALRRSIG